MAVFRVERNTGYTVMSNHHLRNKELSLKAKGLLSQMLSLPEDWDYTLAGCPISTGRKSTLSAKLSGSLNEPGISSVQGNATERTLAGSDYIIYEQPQPLCLGFTYIGKSNIG